MTNLRVGALGASFDLRNNATFLAHRILELPIAHVHCGGAG